MKLTIITINYNNILGLRRTIESVISQPFNNYEYIIIDGGSIDGSKDVISDNSEKINYWISEPDQGIYNAMNKGIEKSNGEYLLFLNSGDYLEKGILSKIDFSTLKSDFILFDYFDLTSRKKIHLSHKKLSFKYLFHSCPKHQAIFIRKELFSRNKYNENNKIVSDWEFILKRVLSGKSTDQGYSLQLVNTDEEGISGQNKFLLEKEKNEIMNSLFPKQLIEELKRLYSIELLFNSKGIQTFITLKHFFKKIWIFNHR